MWGFFCFKLDTTNFMHYLYILYSKSLDKYYVGETSDITQRLNQHFSRFYKGSYTSQTDDWKKKLVIEFSTINQARKAEIFIKKMKSRKFIEQLIEDSIWLKEKFNN
jgi:putative endonuclease